MGSEEEEEEFGFVVSMHPLATSSGGDNVNVKVGAAVVENGELEESGSDKGSDILDPPPIPPRNHSLSPGLSTSCQHDYSKDDAGTADIYSTDPWSSENSGDSLSFLLEGRGGERAYPPLPKMTNGTAANVDNDEESPPPIPTKQGTRSKDIVAEEKALFGELDILEKMMESKTLEKQWSGENAAVGISDEKESEEQEERSPKEYAIFIVSVSCHNTHIFFSSYFFLSFFLMGKLFLPFRGHI